MDSLVEGAYGLEFFKGRKVFVTGHTGFKGAWLVYTLSRAGAIVKGYSLEPGAPSLYALIEPSITIDSVIADINEGGRLADELLSFQPDHVFHLAAQSLVRQSYQQPLDTFSTNIIGTAHVLQALCGLDKPCTAVMVTTDKVYQNREWYHPYRETDRLGGHDPYSASKACAELVVESYRASFFNGDAYPKHSKSIATVRAGNVIGGGDWAPDRLLPDIASALQADTAISIRNPASVRPWQHVLEPVFAYLLLARAMTGSTRFNGAWNFGPRNEDSLPVAAVVQQAIETWGGGSVEVQSRRDVPHEAGLLKLDISKAAALLGWKPRMSTATAIARTIEWYKSFHSGSKSAAELVEDDLLHYQSLPVP